MNIDPKNISAAKSSSNSNWSANLLLLCGAVVLCLGVGEIATRVFHQNLKLFPRYVTDASYGEYTLRRLRPNSVFWHTSSEGSWKFVTNSQGFRDTEDFSYEKPENVLRVLSLGDSHTQGMEVRQDHTFSEVLELFLNSHGVEAQVINSGVSGFSTAEQLAFLENEGFRYEPDFVVVGLYANDFEDNIKAGLFELRDGELVAAKKTHIPGVRVLNWINAVPPLRWLSQNSYLYSYALNSAWNLAKQLLLSEAKARLQTEFSVPSEKLTDYKLDLMAHLIGRMNGFAQRNGIRLIILDIPRERHDGSQFGSSVPAPLVQNFRAHSHAFVLSEDVLGDYRHISEIHIPRGDSHISEFVHLMLGLEVGRAILDANQAVD